MTIDINDHRRLFAIQEEFSSAFPNLKLAFYAKPSHLHNSHPDTRILSNAKTIGECRSIHNKGTLTISPNMTVADLESNFDEVYGVHVGVLKKAGQNWIEPTSKNTLSLTEQNNN